MCADCQRFLHFFLDKPQLLLCSFRVQIKKKLPTLCGLKLNTMKKSFIEIFKSYLYRNKNLNIPNNKLLSPNKKFIFTPLVILSSIDLIFFLKNRKSILFYLPYSNNFFRSFQFGIRTDKSI